MRKEYANRYGSPLVNGPVNFLGEPILLSESYDQLEFGFGALIDIEEEFEEPSDEELAQDLDESFDAEFFDSRAFNERYSDVG